MPISSNENALHCDVCMRTETVLNRIFICSRCKVLWILFGFSCILLYYVNNSGPFYQAAVHIDCYRSVENSIGPWKCELCEDQDISLETSTASDKSDCNGKKLPFARCVMCHGTSGAFRKTTDGQWVHAFCAEVIIDVNLLLFKCLSCFKSYIFSNTFTVVVGHQVRKGTRKSCGRNGTQLYPLS